jgi:hypothetical protein
VRRRCFESIQTEQKGFLELQVYPSNLFPSFVILKCGPLE